MKILLTINMLNEGVHVDGICGVILFRPTISPIIYKQQIGRALSANARREPLILDIVANVYNLFSVDSLQGEIAETVRLLTQKGEGVKIVVDGFTVYDEVRESRKLFEELENTLSSSWDEMFTRLVQFKKQFGHVNVPSNYKTPDKIALGNWCGYQRKIRRGQSNGILTEERSQKVDGIGFCGNRQRMHGEAGTNMRCVIKTKWEILTCQLCIKQETDSRSEVGYRSIVLHLPTVHFPKNAYSFSQVSA